MEEIYARLHDPTEFGVEIEESSEIQKFYAGQTIFLTGCTGYLGKIFVEKLLRSCSDIKRLYVLVRPKKLSSNERMKRYFDNLIFDRMKKENPDFQSKVTIVEGCLTTENLGLSEKDRDILVRETTLICHNASNVKFDEKLDVAIKTNAMGTKRMLDLAKECKNLLAFVYISTAYSHSYQQHIEEKFYPPPGDTKMIKDVLEVAEANSEGLDEQALNKVLGKWPNTYAFTKSTAESFVEECGKTAPFACAVFRPSVVVSTLMEPIRGWSGNMNGPIGLMIGYAIGFVHVIYGGLHPVDYVPADMCGNAMIAVFWDLVSNKNKNSTKEAIVYNYGSSVVNPITLHDFGIKCFERGSTIPTSYMIAPFYMIYTKCLWNFWFLHLTLHLLTALFADFGLICSGKKPQTTSYWTLMTKNTKWIHYYTNGNWRIHVNRMQTIWDRMNPRDCKLFFCDLRKFSWDEFSYIFWAGLRLYILKDNFSTVKASLARHKMFELIKSIFIYTIRIAILYFTYRFLSSILPNISETTQYYNLYFSIFLLWCYTCTYGFLR